MVAAMAIELYLNMYAYGFALAAVIAIVLLVAAARRLAKLDRDQTNRFEK